MRNARLSEISDGSDTDHSPVGAWAELDPALRAAWTGFLKVHAVLTQAMDRDLRAAHGLSLTEYDVLIQLHMAGRPIQMHVLADAVVLSRAGVTRCVAGLDERGLVTRTRGHRDVRQVFAELTADGTRTVEEASVTHVEGISRLFGASLARSDLLNLVEAWRAVLPGPPTP